MKAAGIAFALALAACSRDGAPSAGSASGGVVKEARVDVARSAEAPKASDSDGGARVRLVAAPEDVDALSLVRTKRLEAKAEGRTLVVYAGAGWCPPCKRFHEELRAGRLDDRLGKVTLLVFDADKDADRLASAGYVFRYIPYVALPGADGRPSDTVESTGKGSEAWRGMLGKLDAWQR